VQLLGLADWCVVRAKVMKNVAFSGTNFGYYLTIIYVLDFRVPENLDNF
jgi:hypothetical protein